ncbi:MAG: hypothetical protein WA081_03730 [Desulfosalsimonadaceae bacterium]
MDKYDAGKQIMRNIHGKMNRRRFMRGSKHPCLIAIARRNLFFQDQLFPYISQILQKRCIRSLIPVKTIWIVRNKLTGGQIHPVKRVGQYANVKRNAVAALNERPLGKTAGCLGFFKTTPGAYEMRFQGYQQRGPAKIPCQSSRFIQLARC